ncbi:hypothetical protein IPN35_03270 [Candidatus Peregrinibacteria bacterium]|nr:MAG: hypothetical protein IPN35_03270 [Candidatus Peregrinibacteria bacterium]
MSPISPLKSSSFNLEEMIGELLLVLSDKERTVITKRFSLDSGPRQTLENIGKTFSVTRERIRQIESTALKKLQRNAANPKVRRVSQSITEVLAEHGGLCTEKQIINSVLMRLHGPKTQLNGHIIHLALSITPNIKQSELPKQFHRFWYDASSTSMKEIKKISKTAHQIILKKGDIIPIHEVVEKTIKSLKIDSSLLSRVQSVVTVDMRFRSAEKDMWGLQEWRHINPKSIHDKSLIIMRNTRRPMHFIEIANAISAFGFDNRPVTVQAVHNDLIRYPEFVLVGRGMYALREWGYDPGTVADVIAAILKEQGPLTKKEIVRKVQEQRDIRIGTISLNLQKEKAFTRVGRAVYSFDESQWNPKTSGRGRKKKAIIEELDKRGKERKKGGK